jgi:hypothetical protein
MDLSIDHDLAVTALSVIEMYPSRHNQESWRDDRDDRHRIEDFDDPLDEACGTAFCHAGWIATLDGAKWAAKVDQYPMPLLKGDRVAHPEYCTCPPQDRYCTCGNDMPVSVYAAERVGLSDPEAEALFAAHNKVEDLRAGTKALVNGEDVYDAVHRSHEEHGRICNEGCEGYDEDYDEEDE